MKRLAIVTTHPIQYYAPVFRLLSLRKRIAVKVFYTWGETSLEKFDPGFGKQIKWDVPLLNDYDYVFVHNTSKDPGSHHNRGIINPTLLHEVSAWQPDAVLVYGWNYYSHLHLLRKLNGKISLWFRGDSHLLDPLPLWRKLIKYHILNWVYSHIDLAFYVGEENKRYFQKYGLKNHKLVFAPHAIDNERFFDSPDKNYTKQAMAWRTSLGFNPEDLVVLFAGKLEPQKNPELLLNVIQSYNSQNVKKIKLLFVGNGPLENGLKNQVKKMNLDVVFIDFQNQSKMPIVYRLGNIFCLPSVSETWGLAVNEALASGIPVIVSDRVGCTIDLVHPNKTGYSFKHDNVDQFQLVLQLLVEEIEHGVLKGEPEKFITNWSFERQVEVFERFLT